MPDELTTHSFFSPSYLSPLLGYIRIGLSVTCGNATKQVKQIELQPPQHNDLCNARENKHRNHRYALRMLKRTIFVIEGHKVVDTFRMESISPWINLGGVQFIPTAQTLAHLSAIVAHSINESPLTTWTPSFELKENHAGICMLHSSRSSTYAYMTNKPTIRDFSQGWV